MELLTPWHLALILLGFVLLFGYKRLPDASRSLGRSLRIFKGEVKGMQADDDLRAKEAATATPPISGELLAAAPKSTPPGVAESLEAEARGEEARAAELRDRAEQARSSSTDGNR